jgi:CheY-like chemotaxis protein
VSLYSEENPILDKSPEKLILIVDDQESDQQILARALQRLGVVNPIHRLHDGLEAIRYFNGDIPFSDRGRYPFPSIIFLDLKLPVVSGWEVLDWVTSVGLKGDSKIFVHSELKDISEIRKIYSMGADSYIAKPVDGMELMNLIYHFPKHWEIKADEAET